jgi:hypothetical protein
VALETARHDPAFSRIALYDPGVSIAGSIPTGWMAGYARQLAQGDSAGAFATFLAGMGPAYLRYLPRWYLKLLLPMIMPAGERARIFGLLTENLREHQEVARLDNTFEHYRDLAATVLLMTGGKHQSARAKRSMRQLAGVIPRVETRDFPRLDHFGIDQHAPREVAAVVADFLLRP